MKNKKLYIIFSLLIVIFSVFIISKSLPNDVFSTIPIGNYIINNGIDFVEHFNINEGLMYHNARWLFCILIAQIYNFFSFKGLYIFVIIVSSTIGLSIYNVLLKLKNNTIISFLITLFVMNYMRLFLTARAQLISFLLFILEIFLIELLIKYKKKRIIIGLSIISILIANMHTSIWPMTIVFFMPYVAEYILSRTKIIKKSNRLYYDDINIKLLLFALLITIVSGFVTPLGLTPFTYMFKTMSGFSAAYIDELQKVNIFTNKIMFIYSFLIILFFLCFRKKLKISDIFMILGLYVLAVSSYRNISLFIIGTIIPFSRIIKDLLIDYENIIDIITDKVSKNNIIITVIVFIILLLSYNSYLSYKNNSYVPKSIYPVDAAEYLVKNENIEKMRIFNSFNTGTYLEYKGIKVFLDSRSEIYCEEYNNKPILKDWYYTSTGNINYKDTFKKYNITHALIKKNEVINNFIKYDKDYENIYEDKYFVIYRLKGDKN